MPRKKKEEPIKKITSWYDVNDIYKKGADYTICYGQRVGGKTWSALKVCLKEYKKFGFRFVYLRRWTDDVNTFSCSTLIKQELVDEVFGPEYEVKFRNHVFTLCKTIVNEETGKEKVEKEDIGYAVAVSEAKHRKGTNFPNVHIVFFDEFIDMSGENILPNEYNKFENVISTIKRANKIRIIMCANTVSKYSEYFTKLGINPDKIEQGEIKEYLHPNGKSKVVVQWCPYNAEIGDVAGELTNSKMIETGQWEIPPTDEIPCEKDEQVKERLLCTLYQESLDATLGVYLRYGIWYTFEIVNLVTTPIKHERQFLVIRRIENGKTHSYFNLTTKKTLKNNCYHKLDDMLKDIFDGTDIDIKRELKMGRVFCDTMFTADIFNEIWEYYSSIMVRTLL